MKTQLEVSNFCLLHSLTKDKKSKFWCKIFILTKGASFMCLLFFCLSSMCLNAQTYDWGATIKWGPWVGKKSSFLREPSNVTIYDNRYFGKGGDGYREINGNEEIANLEHLNNDISSVVVPRDKKVTFFTEEYFGGKSITFFPGKYPNIGQYEGFGVMSLRVEYFNPETPLAYFYDKFTTEDPPQRWMALPADPKGYNQKQLACDDCFSTLLLPSSLKVIAYVDPNFKGRNNEANPFHHDGSGYENIHLGAANFENNISSLKVLLQGYRLKKVEFLNEHKTELSDSIIKSKIGYKNDGTNINEVTVTISKSFETSVTQTTKSTWSNTTGISVSVTASPEIFGLGASITTTVQNSTTIGGSSGKGTTDKVSHTLSESITVHTSPNCMSRVDLNVTPLLLEYDMKKTFVPVDAKSKDIPGGIPVISTSKVRIETAQDAYARSIDVCDEDKQKDLKEYLKEEFGFEGELDEEEEEDNLDDD